MFETEHSKTNRLLKTMEYKTNEQNTKYSNWNMQVVAKYVAKYEKLGKYFPYCTRHSLKTTT